MEGRRPSKRVHFQTDDDGRIVFPSALAAAAPLIGVYKWAAGGGEKDRRTDGQNRGRKQLCAPREIISPQLFRRCVRMVDGLSLRLLLMPLDALAPFTQLDQVTLS